MRSANFKGIIIKKRAFMESDLIVSVITEDGSKHELTAKGANGKSKRKSHLELMNLIEGSFYKGRTMEYLQGVRCIDSFYRLKTKLESIMKMHLILEITDKMILAEDPHPKVFQLLKSALQELNREEPHSLTAETALIKLSHELGLLPNFKICGICHERIENKEAKWDGASGTLSCPRCALKTRAKRNFPLKYRKAFEFLKSAKEEDCRKIVVNEEEQKAIQDFIPLLFTRHLNKDLKSMRFI